MGSEERICNILIEGERGAAFTKESKTSSQKYVQRVCIIHGVKILGRAFEKLTLINISRQT